ncbi:AAA family ATPase [Aphanizomenon sp. UHCC 0183]|uniref:AAA family ATPase n=1 Tax=Aphanizomenon sp. UHCC 0183 TaxID=2590028 RepID=UPI001446836C|nr:ATP-binding protein [Aphanizomenon sp. UHCC 0183]MTJ31236.1 AAA family ATPase [Aphanizomenon sp. UHCC 0183]
MLKKLILENWKSFRYAELPLDPLTVLIGTNASGKSNVVEALEFLQRIANGENIEAALAGDKTLSSIRGGVELAARKGENEFSLKLLVGDEEKDYLYNIILRKGEGVYLKQESIETDDFKNHTYVPESIFVINPVSQIYSSKPTLPNYQGSNLDRSKYLDNYLDILAIDNIENKDKRQKMLDEINEKRDFGENHLQKIIDNVILPTIKNIHILNPIPLTMRNYSRLSENIESDGSNIAGVLAALPEEQKAKVESNLSYYIQDLPEGDIKKVWAEKVGRLGTDAMLYCQEEWKPGEITEIDARSMSDGTLRFLAILTALLTRPEGSQIVIEEIDNGLHPSRAALLVKILKEIGTKRNIDILLTTHNPALLDAFGSEIVPFVVVAHRDSETGESKLTLLEDIDNFPKLFASYSLGQMTTKGAIERSLSHGE